MGGGRHALGVDDVLQGIGDAVEGAAILAGGEFGLCLARGGQGAVGGDGDEAVQCVVEARDAIEAGLGQRDRRERAGAEGGPECRDTHAGKLGWFVRKVHRGAPAGVTGSALPSD